MGFTPSAVDQCVYFRDNTVIVCYVDDCLIFAKEKEEIQKTCTQLKEMNFVFTEEGDVIEYLGIQIKNNKDGSMRLSQPYLLKRIIETIPGMKDANPRDTPAMPSVMLAKDVNGKPRKGVWNYRSVIGMMNFVAQSTHPEIAYAVHQCARYCENPKLSHELAVHQIVKYLLHTQSNKSKINRSLNEFQGMIFQPDKNRGLEVYVDASFAGEWNKLNASEATSVLSRTGFVIKYMGCPLFWLSKLQSEISLSTTEAEYIALSHAMRETLPLIEFLREIHEVLGVVELIKDRKIKCDVFEDNNGCI